MKLTSLRVLELAQSSVHVKSPGVVALQNVHTPPWLAIFQGQTVRTVRAVCLCGHSSLKARLCGGGKRACPNLAALCDIYYGCWLTCSCVPY